MINVITILFASCNLISWSCLGLIEAYQLGSAGASTDVQQNLESFDRKEAQRHITRRTNETIA